MPEGPEIHMAAKFINQVAKSHQFGGQIVKSEVSTKNPEVSFSSKHYSLNATAKGKELKVFLKDVTNPSSSTHILFKFGMSGCFKFTSVSDLPKHAHLRFFTADEKLQKVLSFVDYRRFGRWEVEGDWGKDRGPDPIFEFKDFSANIVNNLDKSAFNRPICEVLLNQKYFNGIGNYLRAEILYRAGIPPFTCARDVLECAKIKSDPGNEIKSEPDTFDLLELCHIVPEEVFHLDKGKNYDPDEGEAENKFSDWLKCYYVKGMDNLKDGNGRTIWFSGEAGPMKPKKTKTVGRKGGTGSKVPKSGSNKEEKKEIKPDPDSNGMKNEGIKSKRRTKPGSNKEEKKEIKPDPDSNGMKNEGIKSKRRTKLKTGPEEYEDTKGPKVGRNSEIPGNDKVSSENGTKSEGKKTKAVKNKKIIKKSS